jgi:nucleoside-diphosphate-sugar epimerase
VDLSGAIRSVVAAQESENVRRFVLLSGINSDVAGTRRSAHSTDFDGPLASWHKLKAHSEIYLRESHLYGRRLDWTILCPGRYVDGGRREGSGG